MKRIIVIIFAYAILIGAIVFAIRCPWSGLLYLITTCICAIAWCINLGRKQEIENVCNRLTSELKTSNTQLGESLMQCQVLFAMLPIEEKEKHDELNPDKKAEDEEQSGIRSMEE